MMEYFPENAAEGCPGTQSNDAGKSSACQGCPNQAICSTSKPQSIDPDIKRIKSALKEVKNRIVILSGKGGVGKSTLTAQLAQAFAADPNKQIAVLDIDICGPSLPRIFGVEFEQVHSSSFGWSPVFVQDNISLMSIGFLLGGPDEAVIWRGPKKNGLIKQFLCDVDWGEIDYLLIDTPPGTSDEHLSVVQYLKSSGIDGAVLVTTPQEVALQDVRKEANFCAKMKLPVIGIVENMSKFICPSCKGVSEVFPPTTGGAKQLAETFNIDFLGSVDLDPRIGQCCDAGKSFISDVPDSPATKALLHIASNDLALMAETCQTLQDQLEEWHNALECNGLKISRKKTIYMGPESLELQEEALAKEENFKYLGSTINMSDNLQPEVAARIQ